MKCSDTVSSFRLYKRFSPGVFSSKFGDPKHLMFLYMYFIIRKELYKNRRYK